MTETGIRSLFRWIGKVQDEKNLARWASWGRDESASLSICGALLQFECCS